MADNPYKDFTEEAIKQLERLEARQKKAQEKLDARYKKNLDTENKTHKKLLSNLAEIRKEKNTIIEKQDKVQARISKEQNKSSKSELRLTQQVRKELGLTLDTESQFESITARVTKERAKAAVLTGEEADLAERKDTIMTSVLSDMESQAKAVERALKGEDDRAQFEQRRLDIKSMAGDLSEEETKDLLDAVDYAENLYKKEQRILELKSQQKELYNSMPQSLKSAVTFGQGLVGTLKKAGLQAASFLILTTILTSAVKLFTDLDSAADKFNDDTKIAISQMGEMQTQAANITAEFREIGASAEDFYNLQKELLGVFNDTFRASDSVAKSLIVVTKNFGASESSAAKTLQIFENIGKVNTETAASLELQTLALARQAGVAPAAVIDDIAKSSETIYGAFQGNVTELVRSAITARRLGTEIDKIVASTNQLLDFESSITKELNAAAFVGGQFNLQQARALRFAGKIGESQEEILRQIQRSGDFRNQNLFVQNALAEAAGMTVEEIIQQINNQEKLNSLSDKQRALAKQAMKDGLDINNINADDLEKQVAIFKTQKEQQGVIANIENSFNSIAASAGKVLLPVVEKIASFFQFISESSAGITAFTYTLVGLLTTILGLKMAALAIDIKSAIAKRKEAQQSIIGAVASIFKGQGGVPIVGAVLAAALVGTLFAALSQAKNIGDLSAPAGAGRIQVSAMEGGIFKTFNPSPNDDVVVAPNAISTLNSLNNPTQLGTVTQTVDTQSSQGTDKLIRTIERLEKAYMRGAQVNLDGINVTKRLGRVSDETTKNNFSLV